MTLLDTIRKFGPFTADALWLDIVEMRKHSPCLDLPADFPELERQLDALADAGLIAETEDGEWRAVFVQARPVKAEPQLTMF